MKDWAAIIAGAFMAVGINLVTTDIALRVIIGILTVVILLPKAIQAVEKLAATIDRIRQWLKKGEHP